MTAKEMMHTMIRNTMFLILILLSAVRAEAQLGVQTPSQGSVATTLPVSGRNPQNGSVTSVQTPVPGTTTSVNTINPSIAVQGPFAGSTPSTSTSPFSGRLSLADAIDRALGYNLGPSGLNEIVRQAKGQSRVARS